jgi:hypothetical protein
MPRRVVDKVEWHPGELYPRVGFIVTNGIVTSPENCGSSARPVATGMKKISYGGYRFPSEIIQQAIWLYLRGSR